MEIDGFSKSRPNLKIQIQLTVINPGAHLFWRSGEEPRLLHVQQLLDAQHHSFSAGLSEALLFVTQGQAEAQVQVGATERTIDMFLFCWKVFQELCVCNTSDDITTCGAIPLHRGTDAHLTSVFETCQSKTLVTSFYFNFWTRWIYRP